eukprot:jgi/Tetstr1/443791/TSEL_031779.t1
MAIEIRKMLAAACVANGITPDFGERLEAIVHNMEAVDDDVVLRQRYVGFGTENMGSPELTELLDLYKDVSTTT